MYKKINNRTLFIVFAVLLALTLVLFTNKGSKKESSFNKQLVDINVDDINKITLYPRSLKGESFDLIKEGEEWQISDNGQRFKPTSNTAENMLSDLQDMMAKTMVANKKDRWEEFEVTDSLATRVQLYKDEKKMADVYIGKFKFSQPRSMNTYVRLAGDKEIYKVDGFLTSTFNRDVNGLRDKTVIDDPSANWSEIAFSYPADSSFVLSKVNNRWMLDGGFADSTEVAGFINTLKRQSANSISENAEGSNLYKLDIKQENGDPIYLLVKESPSGQQLESSENKGVWFDDQSLIDRIFVSRSKFEIKP